LFSVGVSVRVKVRVSVRFIVRDISSMGSLYLFTFLVTSRMYIQTMVLFWHGHPKPYCIPGTNLNLYFNHNNNPHEAYIVNVQL